MDKEKIITTMDSWINPIWLLELRTTLRSGRFFAAFAFSLFLCVAAIIFALLILASEYRITPDQIGKGIFSTFFFLEFFVLCVFFPAFTCTGIISEKERKTFDLLITSDLRPSRIVSGKFLAAYTYGFLFIIASMPLVMVAFLFGGISVLIVVVSYGILLVLGMLFILYSLWSSTYYKSTIRAIIGSYSMVLTYSFFLSFPVIGFMMDYLYGKQVLKFFSKPFNINQVMVILIPILIIISLGILPYLLTINSLKPPHANRSTSLKIFYASSIIVILSLFCFWGISYLHSPGAYYVQRESYTLFITATSVIAVILLVGSVGLPLQTKVPGIAYVPKQGKFPTLPWLFAPGALNSAVYMGVLSLLCYSIIFLACSLTGFQSPGWFRQESFIIISLIFWIFLLFISLSSGYFCLRCKTEKTKWTATLALVIILVVIIPLLVPFSMIIDNGFQASLWNFSYLSPILCVISCVMQDDTITKMNFNLFSFIPIYYIGILIYSLASFFMYKEIIPLHKEALKRVKDKKESLKLLQEAKTE